MKHHDRDFQEKTKASVGQTWRFISMWIQNLEYRIQQRLSSIGSLGKLKEYIVGGSKTHNREKSMDSWFRIINPADIFPALKSKKRDYIDNHIYNNYFITNYSEFTGKRVAGDDFSNPFVIAKKVSEALETDPILKSNPELSMYHAMKFGYEFLENVERGNYCDMLFHCTIEHLRSFPNGKIFNNVRPGPDAVKTFVEIVITKGLKETDPTKRFVNEDYMEIVANCIKMTARLILHSRLYDELKDEAFLNNYWVQGSALIIKMLVADGMKNAEDDLAQIKLSEELKSLGVESTSKTINVKKEVVEGSIELLKKLYEQILKFFPEYPEVERRIIEQEEKKKETTKLDENDFE